MEYSIISFLSLVIGEKIELDEHESEALNEILEHLVDDFISFEEPFQRITFSIDKNDDFDRFIDYFRKIVKIRDSLLMKCASLSKICERRRLMIAHILFHHSYSVYESSIREWLFGSSVSPMVLLRTSLEYCLLATFLSLLTFSEYEEILYLRWNDIHDPVIRFFRAVENLIRNPNEETLPAIAYLVHKGEIKLPKIRSLTRQLLMWNIIDPQMYKEIIRLYSDLFSKAIHGDIIKASISISCESFCRYALRVGKIIETLLERVTNLGLKR
ncbi:hypothetical protein DRO64_01385 [Candidatus Bathyarchaeota archaeon]|nr:MAG: hypothetical protein DRN63_04200 [Nanoarchaeota archaeon]RLI46156.1 MAG: hypothetical protein DRO64_01385 [Candidatus Bathyarchaeota archaeon]